MNPPRRQNKKNGTRSVIVPLGKTKTPPLSGVFEFGFIFRILEFSFLTSSLGSILACREPVQTAIR